MNKGDYIIFYAGLRPYDDEKDGLYIVGYFEIEKAIKVNNLKESEAIKKEFRNNFHVMHDLILKRDVSKEKNKGLKLIKGTKNSRLLNKAFKISVKEIYKNIKHPTDILNPELYDTFGNFNGKVSLRRNPIRWIEKDFVEKTISFIKKLK